jgi:hypothetical protein
MGFHFIQAFTIMIVMPLICSVIDYSRNKKREKWVVITKWLLLWAVGIRSVTAGLVQLVYPRYTAEVIFNLSGDSFYIFIRELGVANIAIGTSAVISFKHKNWRVPIAFISLVFNLFLSLNHIVNFQADVNEAVSLVGDVFVVLGVSVFLFKSYRKKMQFSFSAVSQREIYLRD